MKVMRIHSIEHELFEGLADIEIWAYKKSHTITKTHIFNNEKLPSLTDFDWLVIMGGSMNIYEEEKYPWLRGEKDFIKRAIKDGKIVLGICLGAQLLADALGGKVTRNRYKEIGWFPVSLTKEEGTSPVFRSFPGKFTPFHWHADTFQIPKGAIKSAESEACRNQAFECGRITGLQFHLEYSKKSIDMMLEKCGAEIIDGKYIQKPEEIISNYANLIETEKLLELLLDNIEREYGSLERNI